MKLLKSLLVFGLLLTGCTQAPVEDSPNNEPVVEEAKVLSPTGAPALSLLNVNQENVTYVTGAEVLSAELVKEDSEYDIIVAPVNLGAKMIENGKSVYRLKAVITWGNLYVVGTDSSMLTTEGEFATFGEGSVVDFVLKNALAIETMTPTVNYYSSAQDVQGAFLSGNAAVGMLAEPAVTATIKKAKEQGIELQVLMDLQEIYQKNMNTKEKGFPQAAIFVKQGSEEKAADTLNAIASFVNDTAIHTPDEIVTKVDEIGADVLGVPSAAISKVTWEKQNIHYVEASTVSEDLTTLLSLMGITYTEEMLSK